MSISIKIKILCMLPSPMWFNIPMLTATIIPLDFDILMGLCQVDKIYTSDYYKIPFNWNQIKINAQATKLILCLCFTHTYLGI